MDELLRFMSSHGTFLFTDNEFRLTDSEAAAEFGNALIVLSSDTTRLRLVRDRGELILEAQPLQDGRAEWHTLDILAEFAGVDPRGCCPVTPAGMQVLQRVLPSLRQAFEPEKLADTIKQLHQLERARAKKLFG